MEGVLPTKPVRARISKIAVGLAAAADPPDVERKLLLYFSEKFKGLGSLPYIAFMTHDFQFVHGYTGSRTIAEFEKDLDLVENHPLFPATAQDAAKLVVLGEKAVAAAEDGDLPKVLAFGRQGAAIRGRCDERAQVDEAMQFARDYADSEFVRIEQALVERPADKKAAATWKKDLKRLAKLFKGEPEAATAEHGVAAITAYVQIDAIRPEKTDQLDRAKAKALESLGGTRWAPLFGGKGPAGDDGDASSEETGE